LTWFGEFGDHFDEVDGWIGVVVVVETMEDGEVGWLRWRSVTEFSGTAGKDPLASLIDTMRDYEICITLNTHLNKTC
jgi:hypothetical protein